MTSFGDTKRNGARIWVSLYLSMAPVFLASCATPWVRQGTFQKSAQTRLVVDGPPGAKVYVNGQPTGVAPLEKYVDYEQETARETRKITYWRHHKGLALLLLPFSFIPMDTEGRTVATGTFHKNTVVVAVEDGVARSEKTVVCKGEDSVRVDASQHPSVKSDAK